jgi:hypothetical protein
MKPMYTKKLYLSRPTTLRFWDPWQEIYTKSRDYGWKLLVLKRHNPHQNQVAGKHTYHPTSNSSS